MHVNCVLKVKANNATEALETAKSLVEQSVDSDNNRSGWDYVGECKVITPDILKSEYKLQTFEELEKYYSATREEYIKDHQEKLRENTIEFLAEDYLSQEEAPLLLAEDGLKEIVEKILKRKVRKTKPLPKDFLGQTDLIAQTIVGLVRQQYMASYYIRKIDEIDRCIKYPTDGNNTLQCTDNHFADMTHETKGKNIYYVETDRHV